MTHLHCLVKAHAGLIELIQLVSPRLAGPVKIGSSLISSLHHRILSSMALPCRRRCVYGAKPPTVACRSLQTMPGVFMQVFRHQAGIAGCIRQMPK